MRRYFAYLFLWFGLVVLTGCAGSPDGQDETAHMSVSELYEEARDNLISGDYDTAITRYESLESRFPYGPYAERARLEVAYAQYKAGERETAILSADRFIKLHPNHKHVDYAYYLRGLASFDHTISFFDKLFDQDPTQRDPKRLRQAFQYFAELVKKFPKSRYSQDAVIRMKDLREDLAKYETHVAQYYADNGAQLAAANRAKYVVDNYQGTIAIPRALGIMVLSYQKLGMQELAADALRVLEMNYPDEEITRTVKKTIKPQ